ncbi:MAG: VCBS repeat-containing protein [Acidobacteriota bacterium]|nr:VCBS repeat-containing protein [Acidobacteriota bacterium]
MSLRKFLGCVLSVLTFAAAHDAFAADAKKAKPAKPSAQAKVPDGGVPHYIKEETPEQRRERLGTNEDPGLDPDPKKVWYRFGKEFHIEKFDKRWAKKTDTPGWVKAFAFANFVDELYQENEKYVWVWQEIIPDEPAVAAAPAQPAEEPRAYRKLDEKGVQFLESMVSEFTPLDPPKSTTRLTFANASTGLPTSGNWRNSLALADMNGDGKMDILAPPERGGGRVIPTIFLGDGKGNWKFWPTKWPTRLNYGSAIAADFNNDKIMDAAFGIHLSGVAIYLGDGKGGFREVQRVTDYATRRIVARDIDKDGWLDVVAISEGPVRRGNESIAGQPDTNLHAFLNRAKGEKWERANLAGPKELISGDWLASGDFNGDGVPDFAGSDIYTNGVDTIYVSKGPAKYEPLRGENLVPFFSNYSATAAGRFTAKDRDDAIVTFGRNWLTHVDPAQVAPPPFLAIAGVDRISWVNGQPKRFPIMRWGGDVVNTVYGINSGDFDSDGNLDIVFVHPDQRRFVMLLGDGKGGFREATLDGLPLSPQPVYDLAVADMNGDKRPDIVMMYSAEGGTALARKNGKIEVFLNRGVTR